MLNRRAVFVLCFVAWFAQLSAHGSDPVVVEIGGVPTCAAVSAGGTWFVVGRHASDAAVQWYDSTTFEPGRIFAPEFGARMSVNALVLSPDDRLLAASGYSNDADRYHAEPDGASHFERSRASRIDNAVRVWDVENGTLLHTLPSTYDTVNDLAFSPDGRRLAAVTSNARLQVWDLATGAIIHEAGEIFDHTSARCVTFVSNTQIAIAVRRTNMVRLIDLDTGAVADETPAENVRGVTYHAPTKTFIAMHHLGVHRLSREPFEVFDSIDVERPVPLVHSVDLTPSGRYAVVSHSEPAHDTTRPIESSGIAIFDLEAGTTSFDSGALPGGTVDAAFIAGRRVFALCRSGTLHVWPTFLAEPAWPASPARSTFRITPTHLRFDPAAPPPVIASPFDDAPDAVRESMIGVALTDAYHTRPPAALLPERHLHALDHFLGLVRMETLSTVLSFTKRETIDDVVRAARAVLPPRYSEALTEAIAACTVADHTHWSYYKPNEDAEAAIDALGAPFRDDHADITRAICAYGFAHQQQLRAFRMIVRDVMPELLD